MLSNILKNWSSINKRLLSTENHLSCLVLLEHKNGRISPSSFPVISAANELSDKVSALVAGGSDLKTVIDQASQILGVNKVYTAQHEMLKHDLAEPVADLLAAVQKQFCFTHVLAPATTFGKNILPRAAGILGIEQVSDITKIKDRDTFERPIYAGNAVATVKYKTQGVRLLTIRPTAFESGSECKDSSSKPCPVESVPDSMLEGLDEWKSKIEWLSEETKQSDRPDLASAKIVIAGGRALQSQENFQLLEKLAEKLGAAVGATRAAVDAGYAPNDWQIGQTGKVVAPDLYIALGISGAIQHLAGMTGSKTIVAINTDPEAPIFDVADYGLVHDLFAALPELQKEIDTIHQKE